MINTTVILDMTETGVGNIIAEILPIEGSAPVGIDDISIR
jgi:hypothetical protein